MGLPGKQELLRVFPKWDATRRRRTGPRIAIRYGPAFLRMLKSTALKNVSLKNTEKAGGVQHKRKHEIDSSDQSRKRIKTDKLPTDINLEQSDLEKEMDDNGCQNTDNPDPRKCSSKTRGSCTSTSSVALQTENSLKQQEKEDDGIDGSGYQNVDESPLPKFASVQSTSAKINRDQNSRESCTTASIDTVPRDIIPEQKEKEAEDESGCQPTREQDSHETMKINESTICHNRGLQKNPSSTSRDDGETNWSIMTRRAMKQSQEARNAFGNMPTLLHSEPAASADVKQKDDVLVSREESNDRDGTRLLVQLNNSSHGVSMSVKDVCDIQFAAFSIQSNACVHIDSPEGQGVQDGAGSCVDEGGCADNRHIPFPVNMEIHKDGEMIADTTRPNEEKARRRQRKSLCPRKKVTNLHPQDVDATEECNDGEEGEMTESEYKEERKHNSEIRLQSDDRYELGHHADECGNGKFNDASETTEICGESTKQDFTEEMSEQREEDGLGEKPKPGCDVHNISHFASKNSQGLVSEEDPMLASGGLSCSSVDGFDMSQVPSSFQTGQTEGVMVTEGLRFQSLQSLDFFAQEASKNCDSLTTSGFATIVNSSLNEENDLGSPVDNLLPGLNMLHLSRSETTSVQPVPIEATGGYRDKSSKKKLKSKLKKHRHERHHKSKSIIASAGRHLRSRSKKSVTPVTSPIFEMGLPVSKWSSLDKPITSQSDATRINKIKNTPDLSKAGTDSSVIPYQQRESHSRSNVDKSEPQRPVADSSTSERNLDSDGSNILMTTYDKEEHRVQTSSQEVDELTEATTGQSNKSRRHQEDEAKLLSSDGLSLVENRSSQKSLDEYLDYQDNITHSPPSNSTHQNATQNRYKKHVNRTGDKKSSFSHRGAGGWEDSLRQCPSKVTKFQIGNISNLTRNSSAITVTPKKQKSQSQIQEVNTKVKQPSQVLSTPKLELLHRKKQREVAKPPPMNPDSTKEAGLGLSRKDPSVTGTRTGELEKDESFPRGQLVIGKMKGYCWWPGRIAHQHDRSILDPPPPLSRWVQWFGDNKYSLLSMGQLMYFEKFAEYFNPSTFQRLPLYQKACYHALNLAAERAGKELSSSKPAPLPPGSSSITDRQEYKRKMLARCEEMKDWASTGFVPGGPSGIWPSEDEKCPPPAPVKTSPPSSPEVGPETSQKKKHGKGSNKTPAFQDVRDTRMKEVLDGKWQIEEICIGCGSLSLTSNHPLFVGGMCEICRVEYLEVAYLYDVEGYQAHCCICAEGNQIVLCSNQGCYRSYCTTCLDFLVGPGEAERVTAQDPWSCYICSSDNQHGHLHRRIDWQQQLMEFFIHDRFMEFTPLRVYTPRLPADRRPIRVLSLFDGIGTGMLVLKDLGFKIDCYYASEINEDAIMVASVRQEGNIKHVGDVRRITSQEMDSWGRFDLLIGGSPCNDLSIVNPARKGLHEGTGRLFFDFFRVLKALQPRPDDPRPFFWLFENVIFMGHRDKQDICRFLECHPVLVDAQDMSPTRRARYYWGNLPGMHRPNVASADSPLSLQECLEPHCDRRAQFSKVRTITTRSNSIRQTKDAILPVIMNGKEDGLWSTELERLFGFPDHYTDIGNLSRTARQKLLGAAWSVPVIRHLLAPLKDYYLCQMQK